MTNHIHTQNDTAEEQRRFCPERWCRSGAWLVQRAARLPDVWQVSHATDGGTWTIAAVVPVCPRCGATLRTSLELDGGLGGDDVLQPGAVLDWLRTL